MSNSEGRRDPFPMPTGWPSTHTARNDSALPKYRTMRRPFQSLGTWIFFR